MFHLPPPYWFHAILSLIQLLTCIVMGFLAKFNSIPLDISLNKWKDGVVSYTINGYIEPMCMAFISMSCLFHAYIAYYYESYAERVPKFSIRERWIEYSFSASLMHVVICMQVGVHDIFTLACVFVLTQLCMATGLLLETHLEVVWFYAGCYPFMIVWAIIGTAFGLVVSDETPWFVFMIVFGIGFLDCLFAFNAVYLIHKGNRIKSEWNYCFLSIISKQLLVWLTFEGARQR